MKKIFQLLAPMALIFGMASCDKVDDLPFYGTGQAAVLTASATTVAPVPADSNNVALTLTWTYPDHKTDTANIKYTIEMDSVGKNFANPLVKIVMGKQSATFAAKEINTFLLGKGYAFNVPVDMEIRMISSYANNNERIVSNKLAVKVTPYKVPPRVALPTTGRLFLVGGATQGGWTNPVPVPSQELARVNETTWGGIFQLNGDQQYLLLPLNGDWGNKFSVANNTVAGLAAGGDFGFNLPDNFPGPATSGYYSIVVDFQTGKFKVTPFPNTLPTELYIVGDATVGGWNNAPPIAQKFTRINAVEYEITVPLVPGKAYKFLSSSGNWAPQFGGPGATGGVLGANWGGGNDPDAVPTPALAGNYKINVNFLLNTYTVTKL
jgi:hypothetical protein